MSAVVWFAAGFAFGTLISAAAAWVAFERERALRDHDETVTHLDAWTRRTGGDAA